MHAPVDDVNNCLLMSLWCFNPMRYVSTQERLQPNDGFAANPMPLAPPCVQKESQTIIDMNEPVSLTFAMRYLVNFAKATPLSDRVSLTLTKDLPIQVCIV